MRKTILRRIGKTAAGAAVILAAGGYANASQCTVTVNELLKQIPIRKKIKIIQQEPVTGGVCEVIAGVRTPYGQSYLPIYYLKNGRGVIIGAYFRNDINITNMVIARLRQTAVKKAFTEVKKELPSVVIASYRPKNANGKILYAFVDPLCPFCRMAEKHFIELADRSGYTIDLVPFIVHGLPAKKRAESFICEHKSFKDWIENNFGKGGDNCRRADEIIRKAASIVAKLHFGGTPTFITSSGEVVEGADMLKLKKILEIRR